MAVAYDSYKYCPVRVKRVVHDLLVVTEDWRSGAPSMSAEGLTVELSEISVDMVFEILK